MPFSEHLKLRVKRRAHFACSLCHAVGVEVHHIVPEGEGGPDTDDNAAPLCPTCHETYGANPAKRKFIREVRDFWYEACEKRYQPDHGRLEQIATVLNETATKGDLDRAVEVLAQVVRSSRTEQGVTNPGDPSPVSAPWNEAGLRTYLRWLYPDATHCGPEGVRHLLADLQEVGYKSIADLDAIVGDTREGFHQFAVAWRDQGQSVDATTDSYPIRLFLALFDESYCRMHYPHSYVKRDAQFWRRRVDQDREG